MKRWTARRENGIKTGYWSNLKKEDLIQHLAEYENTGLYPAEIKELQRNQGKPWHNLLITPSDLPKNDTKVFCCTITKKGVRNYVIGYYSGRWCCGMNSNVIGWKELDEFDG